MSLAWHQLRKDLRQHGLFLATWLAVLLVELGIQVWLCPRAAVAAANGRPDRASTLVFALGLLHTVLGGALPALVVLADSPARREGFLATRPMPRRDLVLAKFGFIAVLVILPAALQEAVAVASLGTPWLYVARAAGERALGAVLLALLPACLALHWGSLREYLTKGLCLLLGLWGLLTVGGVAATKLHGVGGPPLSAGLAAKVVWCGVLILPFALVRGTPLVRRWRQSLVAAAGVLACLTYLAWPWDWDCFPARRWDVGRAVPSLEKSTIGVRLADIGASSFRDSGRGLQALSLSLPIELAPLPADCHVQWSAPEATVSVGGRSVPCLPQWRQPSVFSPEGFLPDADCTSAWAAALGPGSTVVLDSFHSRHASANVLIPARLLGGAGALHGAALSCRFTGDLFRWERLAEVPLSPGARADLPLWHCTLTRVSRAENRLEVSLLLREARFSLAIDPNLSSARHWGPWQVGRYVCLLYSPADRLALRTEGHAGWGNWFRVGSGTTATGTAHLALRFAIPTMVPELATDPRWGQARLVVLRKRYVGSLGRWWDSGPLLLPAPGFYTSSLSPATPPSEAEFRQRMAALTPPPVEAPRQEVGRYLYEVLHLTQAKSLMLEPDHPLVQVLAAYAPRHLDLFLDGLQASDSPSYVFLAALTAGLTEEQKPALIARLPQQPRLIEVICRRGWIDEARDSLYMLLNQAGPLDRSVLAAVAWFRDPQTYPRLLDELESHPDLTTYHLLRRLPGIEAALDASVARLWERHPPVISGWGEMEAAARLSVALRHGHAEALREAYRRLAVGSAAPLRVHEALLSALQENLVSGVPITWPSGYEAFAAWLLRHRPEDFLYDAGRRRFVLRAGAE